VLDQLNSLAGSAFIALILLMVGTIFLYRLYTRSLDSSDKAWDVVRTLTDALRDSNGLMDRMVDVIERRSG
jgi:hypothetical protein